MKFSIEIDDSQRLNLNDFDCGDDFFVHLINPGETRDSGDVMPYVEVLYEVWSRRKQLNSMQWHNAMLASSQGHFWAVTI